MKLALQIPWGPGSSPTSIGNNPVTRTTLMDPSAVDPYTGATGPAFTLGSILTQFANVAIYVGAFLMFFWAAWGVFDYIRAEGNKEALAKARKRIQWAIAGFIVLLLAFYISDFVKDSLLLNPDGSIIRPTQKLQNLTAP